MHALLDLLPHPPLPLAQVQLGSEDAEPLIVAFIVATIENEQAPEKAGRCVRFFNRNEHSAKMLAGLHFTVLGLGDSNLLLDRQTTTAKDCNAIAQTLDRRLLQLGATRFYKYGEADDRTGNAEVGPWMEGFADALVRRRQDLAGGDGGGGDGDKAATRAVRAEAEAAAAAEQERINALAAKWL